MNGSVTRRQAERARPNTACRAAPAVLRIAWQDVGRYSGVDATDGERGDFTVNSSSSRKTAYDAYLILVELPHDDFFSAEGVCTIGTDGSYTVYSDDSRHNFLRQAILKHPLQELLEDGVRHRGALVRLEDLAQYREQRQLTAAAAPELLAAMYRENSVRHYYLARYAPAEDWALGHGRLAPSSRLEK